VFSALEDELTLFSTAGYMGNGSPGRADALVWCLSDLMTAPMSNFGIFEVYRCQALGLPIQRDPATDNRAGWRKLYDEMSARATPLHADCRGGDVEFVNGPHALLPRPADRMLERCAAENQRFLELSRDGRMPTPAEIAEHVAAIDNIKTGR
jgi:hypothetical protein